MKQPTTLVAQNLKTVRQDRNLSLSKLSELTGVSKSMLRQIETGQSSPTIATLWKIANGLHVPFTALLESQDTAVTQSAFKANEPLETGPGGGYRLYPLVLFDPKRSFEMYYVEIDPGITLDAEPHQGQAQEYVFCLQGQIEITVGDHCYTVQNDHFIDFAANRAHRYQNLGQDTVTAMMLISYQ